MFHGGKGAANIVQLKNAALADYGKCICNYGVVLELCPDEKTAEKLNQQIGNARFVRNNYLSQRQEYYNQNKKTLTVSEYKKEYLPKLKKENEFLKLSDKFALEHAVLNVDNAYKRFFNGTSGFPKYASKQKPNGNSYTTSFTNNNIELIMENNKPYVKLPKVGLIQFILPKGKKIEDILPAGTSIKTATVSKSGHTYKVSICMETVMDKPVFEKRLYAKDILSVDLGLKHYGVFGNLDEAAVIKNPRWIQVHAKRLRRLQKAMSRKQYDQKTHTGSKNWEKTKAKVAKEQRKTANQRKDFQHKLSRYIVDSCMAFVCEDLAVKNMMKNRHLSKAIASVGWASFLEKIKYKMEWAGKYFIKINRWTASSQTCHCCGHKNTDVKDLGVRTWTCPSCGAVHDRDENAQKNICLEGIKILEQQGVTVIC